MCTKNAECTENKQDFGIRGYFKTGGVSINRKQMLERTIDKVAVFHVSHVYKVHQKFVDNQQIHAIQYTRNCVHPNIYTGMRYWNAAFAPPTSTA